MTYEFKVTETERVMEPITPYDRFGLDNEEYENWPAEMAKNLGMNEKTPELAEVSPALRASTEVDTYDYTAQLEFHKQEVAEAPKRGMPEAQVNYHLGKIAVLENIPSPPRGPSPSPEQHQLDCKKDEGSCSCGG